MEQLHLSHITFSQWKERYTRALTIADRTSKMITERAKRTCKEAGLDPQLLGIHPHNAMVAYRAGQPWPNIDYAKVRKVLWLIEKSYQPGRIVEAYADRLWQLVKVD
jgi:hypothetical protein